MPLTTDMTQQPMDAVSPNLGNEYDSVGRVTGQQIPASMGHYATTHVWVLDSTTLLPVGVRQVVQTGTAGVHEIGS